LTSRKKYVIIETTGETAMREHKHKFSKWDWCDICGKSLEQIENERNADLKGFAKTDTTGKPSARDWDKA
jgi:ribosomal protein L34E